MTIDVPFLFRLGTRMRPLFAGILLSALFAFGGPSLRDSRDSRDWKRIWRDPAGFFFPNCNCCATGHCCTPTPADTLNYSISNNSNCPCSGMPKTGTVVVGLPDIWTGSINNADGCGMLSMTVVCQSPQTACTTMNMSINNAAGCNASASANPSSCSCPLNATYTITICTTTCSCCGGGSVPSKVNVTLTE